MNRDVALFRQCGPDSGAALRSHGDVTRIGPSAVEFVNQFESSEPAFQHPDTSHQTVGDEVLAIRGGHDCRRLGRCLGEMASPSRNL